MFPYAVPPSGLPSNVSEPVSIESSIPFPSESSLTSTQFEYSLVVPSEKASVLTNPIPTSAEVIEPPADVAAADTLPSPSVAIAFVGGA